MCAEQSGETVHDDETVSVVANALGFEMLRHDGREVRQVEGVEVIDVTDDEAARCRVAAHRVLDHLAAHIGGTP